jgi:hypothetical protein
MRARYIQYVDGPACMERVAAQHDHFLTGEGSIKLLFVFAESFQWFVSMQNAFPLTLIQQPAQPSVPGRMPAI